MVIEYDITQLKKLVEARDVAAIKSFMTEHSLILMDGRIVPVNDNKSWLMTQYEYWDMQQLIAKIKLNSLYGCILNENSRWYDSRIGQSVTLTGRCVVRHMMGTINELVTGEYNHLGAVGVYGDTDSCLGSTLITTNKGLKSIEELFLNSQEYWMNGDKYYSRDPDLKVLSYDPKTSEPRLMPTEYVYRHKTSKPRWKITDEFGNSVEVTGDHSIMVERDGNLIEAKAAEIIHTDLIIIYNEEGIVKGLADRVEYVSNFNDEYVYDIGIKGDIPYFFGNNILLHNSSYFSVYNAWVKNQPKKTVISSEDQFTPILELVSRLQDNAETQDDETLKQVAQIFASLSQEQIECITLGLGAEEAADTLEADDYDRWTSELDAKIAQAFPTMEVPDDVPDAKPTVGGMFGHRAKDFDWDNREEIIKLYDDISDEMNKTFPAFMDASFHTGEERGAIIKAGRELVAENALYIKKKRYAALVIDLENNRLDTDGKPGKLKAMGLETKRSDTPQFVQEFLEEVLIDVLKGMPEDDVLNKVKQFRKDFEKRPGWQKGRPTAIKGLTKYAMRIEDSTWDDIDLEDGDDFEMVGGRVGMPGHVKAAINFNNMLKEMNDLVTSPIRDGDKIVVVELKRNNHGIEKIARPVDVPEQNLPQWFKDLPFDHEKMEASMIDVKIDNLIGILRWDLRVITDQTAFYELFEVKKSVPSDLPAIDTSPKKKGKKKEKVDLNNTGLFG